jgi:hypothetical protein
MFMTAFSPAANAQTCMSGVTLDVILSTNSGSCNIGALDFTFSSFSNDTYSYNGTSGISGSGGLAASDFTFTTFSNGFTLSLTSGTAPSITAPLGLSSEASNEADLYFSLLDSGGNLIGMSAAGEGLSATGTTSSYALTDGSVFSSSPCCYVYGYYEVQQDSGVQSTSTDDVLIGLPFSSSNFEGGDAEPFSLDAENGDSASWDGSTTTFTFDTVSATPEPASLILFGTGMLGIICVLRKRLFG